MKINRSTNNLGKVITLLLVSLVTTAFSIAIAHGASRYSPNELLVKYKITQFDTKTGTLKDTGLQMSKAVGGLATNKIFRSNIAATSGLLFGWRKLTLAPGVDPITAQKALLKNPNIEAVSLNYELTLAGVPNDPRFSEQWSLVNSDQSGGIDAKTVWDTRTSTDSIVVAVLDTGVDYTHEDLNSNMWINLADDPTDGIDNDGNGCIDDLYGCDVKGYLGENLGMGGLYMSTQPDPSVWYDDSGHGTHVAGIIGAVGNNGLGVSGVAWNTKIMAVKILSRIVGGCVGCQIDTVVRGIEYAVNNGANIINASWGLVKSNVDADGSVSILSDAFEFARTNNVLIVAAAHNQGLDIDNPASTDARSYPALFTHDNLIVVANSDQNNLISASSNYGIISVDLAAPGTNILSTVPARDPLAYADIAVPAGYVLASGTSMASPMVAGAAALIWAQDPSLTAVQVKQKILGSVTRVASLQDKLVTGGRLNLNAALNGPKPFLIGWLIPIITNLLL